MSHHVRHMFCWLPSLNVWRRMCKWMSLALAYTVLVALIDHLLDPPKWTAGNQIAASLGVVLGIMIGFRNHTAHDRWWEARKAWGQLINDARNLALKTQAYGDVPADEHRQLGRLLSGFAQALMLHVRGQVLDVQSLGIRPAVAASAHTPGLVAGQVLQLLGRWDRQGRLHNSLWMLDQHARSLMDVCGTCERIRNTPLPSSYRSLLRWGIVLYVAFAPWSVSLELGWWSVPTLAIGFSFLIGMELTAEEIEEPFGNAGDDLPMEKFCQTIDEFMAGICMERADDGRESSGRAATNTEYAPRLRHDRSEPRTRQPEPRRRRILTAKPLLEAV